MDNKQDTTNTKLNELVKYFNTETSFDPVVSLNEFDLRTSVTAIKQYGVDVIKQAFSRANNSRFLTGNKGYEWKASFGWLIKPENIQSILNGKYDDYKRKPEVPQHSENLESSLPDDVDDELIKSALARGFNDLFK